MSTTVRSIDRVKLCVLLLLLLVLEKAKLRASYGRAIRSKGPPSVLKGNEPKL